jgi:hypothetical protein
VVFAAIAVFSAAVPAAQAPQPDDNAAIMNHRLTLSLVKQVVAVDRDLVAVLEKDPTLQQRVAGQNPVGLDASVKMLEGVPEAAAILKKHSITARDYLLTQIAFAATAFTAEMLETKKLPAVPAGMPTHNLEFWKANAAELKPLEAESKKLRAELQKRLGR